MTSKKGSHPDVQSTDIVSKISQSAEIKDMVLRKFADGKNYLLRHLNSMIPEGNPELVPKFWDDGSLTLEETSQVEWMAGVEVHLHKNIIALYGRDKHDYRKKYLGPILVMYNTPEGFTKFQEDLANFGFKISRFLMETTGIYHFPVAWFLQETYPEAQVIVMNARFLKDYMPKVSKNDKADAVRIAQVAQLDDFIKGSYIPNRDEYALRELLRQRGNLMLNMVQHKNRIRKIFASAGFTYHFNFDNEWEKSLLTSFLESDDTLGNAMQLHVKSHMVKKNWAKLTVWSDFSMPDGFKANLLLLFGLLNQSILQLQMVESALMRKIEDNEALKAKLDLLEECDGIGVLTAAAIIIESGNMQRFHSVSHYLSYCGISPASGTSGYASPENEQEKIVNRPKPNPMSNHHLKTLFIGATGSIMRAISKDLSPSAKNNDMLMYASRYMGDLRPKMKIKFKIAAKLARKIYYCLKTGLKYDPKCEYNRTVQKNAKSNKNTAKKIPKRNRQAWAYVKMQSLHMDIKSLLERIDVPGGDPAALVDVKRNFEQFMRKYLIPDTIEQCSGGDI